MEADVVVVGAGALGLSTALHCALAGRSVAVVDRETAGSQASGRAAGLFKSVQADELRTRLARRSIDLAVSFAGWAGVPLAVARSGSFLIARTAQHGEYLRRELAQSRRWGADVREAAPAQVAGLSYYRAAGPEFALWWLLSSPRSLRCRVPSSAVTLSGTGVSPAQPRTAAHAHRSRWRRQDATGAAGCRPSPGIRPRRRMDDRLRPRRSESTIRGYLARQQMPPADGHDAQGQHLRPWWHPVTADRWIGGSRGQAGVPP